MPRTGSFKISVRETLKPLLKRPPWPLALILVLVGFLLVVTGTATLAQNRTAEPRRQAIVKQILDQQAAVKDLDGQVVDASAEVATANAAAGEASSAAAAENRKRQLLAMDAGTIAVQGPGLTVTLSDAPNRNSDAAFDATRIQDNDLQLVVNALFAAGAEAVAINDNRVVAVTSIRAAGGTIVVNYRPVNSPYKVVAIGADKDKFNNSEIAKRFAQWRDKYQLGFSVDRSRKLSAPAYSGRVGIDYAQSVTTTTAAPSTTSTTARASRNR